MRIILPPTLSLLTKEEEEEEEQFELRIQVLDF